MNAMEIALVAVLGSAGILAATFATIYSMVRHAREDMHRRLFDAYVRHPREFETWLLQGAVEHLRHVLAPLEPPGKSVPSPA